MKALSIARSHSWAEVAGQIVFFSILTALCAQVRFYLPFTPVPITLQSFAVVMAGVIIGKNRGALSQAFLIVLGGLGLHVFSGNLTGWQAILGPTGGYILGFILAAYVVGAMKERGHLEGFWRSSFWMFVASLFIFLPGVLWLKIATQVSIAEALMMGFVPFIIGDIIKTFLASGALWTWKKLH